MFLTRQTIRITKQVIPIIRSNRRMATTAKIDIHTPFKLHNVPDDGPALTTTLTKSDAIHYYRQMRTIRQIEIAVMDLHDKINIHGYAHLYSGEEAVCVGMEASLQRNDSVVTGFRTHGWGYTRGLTPREILAEVAGKKTGCVKGKGGSMHLYGDKYYGGQAIVGAQVPLGAGLALAGKYLDNNSVCVSLYGDGAADQGQIFETFNMAKLWRLPVIFVCENNDYGDENNSYWSSAKKDFYSRCQYVPGLWVDGSDVLAVREATKWATQFCRDDKGPVLLEIATQRNKPFARHIKLARYELRNKNVPEKSKDPIIEFQTKILTTDLVTAPELEAIDKAIEDELDSTLEQVVEDPELAPHHVYTDLYKDLPGDFNVRGLSGFEWHKVQKQHN